MSPQAPPQQTPHTLPSLKYRFTTTTHHHHRRQHGHCCRRRCTHAHPACAVLLCSAPLCGGSLTYAKHAYPHPPNPCIFMCSLSGVLPMPNATVYDALCTPFSGMRSDGISCTPASGKLPVVSGRSSRRLHRSVATQLCCFRGWPVSSHVSSHVMAC